jgi:C1A family cysteine protease
MAKLTLRQLQSQLSSSPARWRAGATNMSELSPADQERRLGLLVKEQERSRIEAYLRSAPQAARALTAAQSSDWRAKNDHDWTTLVRDQGNCGSCVAFATVATLETQARIQFNKPNWNIDLSEAELFFCGAGRKCNEGWWPTDAMDYAEGERRRRGSVFPISGP